MTPAGAPAPRRRRRGLRALALGEAGAGPAWVMAAVALLSVFIAMAGPRELAAVQASALRSAVAGLLGLDTGVAGQAEWQVAPGGRNALTTSSSDEVTASIVAALRPTATAPPRRRWAAVASPAQAVLHPARQAVLSVSPPTMEVVYRSGLRANSRLVSGSLPDAATTRRGTAGRPAATTFDAAVTTATAARFGLRVGSRVDLGRYLASDPAVLLRVTAIVTPADPASAFWQADPVLAAPLIPNPGGPSEFWTARAIVGPAELAALQRAFAGAVMQAEWYFPLDLQALTPPRLPHLLAGLSGLTAASGGPAAQAAVHGSTGAALAVSSGVSDGLSGFLARQQATGAIDSLLIADVFIADLLLMCVCAWLAVGAHRGELTLIRARGGSTAQLAGRMLGRAACLTGPAVAVGAGLAIAAVPAAPGGAAAGWALGGLAALAALVSPAVLAAWTYRRPRPGGAGRADLSLSTPRSRRRRLVAELMVVAGAAGALVAVRLQGVGPDTDPYARAAPVLVAAAAGLIAARLYPVPVTALLRLAAGRRGAVGFLGLARAARSRLGAIAPALILVISLTLATFAVMVVSSVGSGQSAAAWQQVGADVMIAARGNSTVSPAARRAVGAVPGVGRTAAVYTDPGHGAFAPMLLPAGGGPRTVSLVVARPAQYAALARQTPWPRFPAGALARGTGPAVPVLASAGLAAGTLIVDGTRLRVRVAGTIGATPAMPGGGALVVLPAWAEGRLPSIPGPDTLLATGAAIDLPALRAAVRRTMPGAQLESRAQVLSALQSSPAQLAATRLYQLGIWVAAALAVIALLFALAVSAGSRARLVARLTALGMGSRQARALALTEVLPLLSVAVAGTLVAGAVLAAVVGPVLNLAVFTGSAGQVPVRPDPGMLLPAAGIVLLAVVIVAVQGTAFLRRDVAAALRREEAE